MFEASLLEIDQILGVLTEAVRSQNVVRAYLREPQGSGRPARIVEGQVLEVADGRDARTRVRFVISTSLGESVEVRVLVESIEQVELIIPQTEDGPDLSISGPVFSSVQSATRSLLPLPACVTSARSGE